MTSVYLTSLNKKVVFAAAPKNLGRARFRRTMLFVEEFVVVAANAAEVKKKDTVASRERVDMLKNPVLRAATFRATVLCLISKHDGLP